uniref:DNA-binding protein RAP1 n=1 Tax=Ganoderma boninense TaxID=34458 RepID=A0A5K1K0F5_9APHY|nr:Cytochrome P450 monooxygenase CYP52X1 [Ganoderma boninense]
MPARSSSHRNEFSTKEDDYLAQYIAKYNPQREGRTGNKLYQRLVENAQGKWPWHQRHTWQSWRERYRTDQAQFDRRIARHLLKASAKTATKSDVSGPSVSPAPTPAPHPAKAKANAQARASESPAPEKRERVPYTMEDDDHLAEYLAANSLSRQGRQGKNLYEAITDTRHEVYAAHSILCGLDNFFIFSRLAGWFKPVCKTTLSRERNGEDEESEMERGEFSPPSAAAESESSGVHSAPL